MKRKGLLFVGLTILICMLSLCFIACNEEPHVHEYKRQTSETMHWLKCDCGDIKDFNLHSGGTATEEERATCEVCNSEYGTTLNHTHNFNKQEVKETYLKSKATCEEKAEYYYSCSCGAVSTETFEYGEVISCNYLEGVCEWCSEPEPSSTKGLTFTLINNDLEYEVSRYNGSSTEVYIASTHNGKPVTSIGSFAFYSCRSLTSVTIGNSVTSIGGRAFFSCDSLISVIIGNSVTSIGDWAFYYCDSLTSIIVDANNLVYKSIDGNLYSKNGKELIQYAIGKTTTSFSIPDSVTSIGSFAFYNCDSLTSVTIGNSVTSIGYCAFSSCNSLTSIEIPDGVTSIGSSAFYYCDLLTNIIIPDSVTSIGSSAFSNCISLKSVTIGNSVTSIGDHAFYDCESLQTIEIPNSVTSIGCDAFYGCSILRSITFGGTSSQWNSLSVGYYGKVICSDGTING